jgi:hypothetical protein
MPEGAPNDGGPNPPANALLPVRLLRRFWLAVTAVTAKKQSPKAEHEVMRRRKS